MYKIIKTLDNTDTLYSEHFKEHYHSVNGAIEESLHVFINAGLRACNKNTIHIFEVGFGTGLNAYLTLLDSITISKTIFYTAVELYPLDKEIVSKLNYSELLGINKSDLFQKLHSCNWEKQVKISNTFYLRKLDADFNKIELNTTYDLIFFDAFSPEVQPELWSLKNFQKLYNALNTNGILTTYSSKGFVKQNLREAGFIVKRLAGPKGKRHMVKAFKHGK